MFRRLFSVSIAVFFLLSIIQPIYANSFSINQLPVPGVMVQASAPFIPLAIKGMKINTQNPLEFRFIVDTGEGERNAQFIREQSHRLIKYFLAGLTVPEGDLWVNLSPYEKDRIIPASLGQTDLGRDLLAQDYLLKQLTSSFFYPENRLGKEFWQRVYAQAKTQLGTADIPVHTFNKVWIISDQAHVFSQQGAVYITQSRLKVLLDEDYLARKMNNIHSSSSLTATIVRNIIIPEIEKEVNTGKNFAQLRQMHQALILAKWYKESIDNRLLESVYTDKSKLGGIQLDDPTVKDQIYQRYVKAYKKGVFNYISEEQSYVRKYFAGGIVDILPKNITYDRAMQTAPEGEFIELDVELEQEAENSIERKIAELIEELDNLGYKSKVHGTDLVAYSRAASRDLVKFIQKYSVLKKPEDIRRVLLWRLQALKGVSLSGISKENAEILYNAVFDQDKLLEKLTAQKPLSIVLFRKASSQQLTLILRSLKNVQIKIVLSGTDDGLSWFQGAREFDAIGISGAGRALIDLAEDIKVAYFLNSRIKGDGIADERLEANFRALLIMLKQPRTTLDLSDKMLRLYHLAMDMNVDKRQRIVGYLSQFLDKLDKKRESNPNLHFPLRNIPLRSLVLVGAHQGGDWQGVIDEVAELLSVAPGNEVILPTIERQHLVGVKKDGTVYFAETGMNLYPIDSSFVGLWLVDTKQYQKLVLQKNLEIEGRSIVLNQVILPSNGQLSNSQREEVFATTRKIDERDVNAVVGYLASVSSTSNVSTQPKVSLTQRAERAIRESDSILISNRFFETNVGGAFIVPGIGEVIEGVINEQRQSMRPVRISWFEIGDKQRPGEFLNKLMRTNLLLSRRLDQNVDVYRRDLGNYVDYVLAGKLSPDDLPWVEQDLSRIEHESGYRVKPVTVDAQKNSERGSFSSIVLREAIVALMGIQKAGFVVSDNLGLILSEAVKLNENTEQSPLGLFHRDSRVLSIIKYVKQHWNEIKTRGAFVFDVDKTILPKGSKGLHEFQELAHLFMRLLREHVPVVIISGNSKSEQVKRIYAAIKSEMKDDVSAFKNLTFYVNGGATKVNFDQNGEMIDDVPYGMTHGMNAQHMRQAINEVMQDLVKEKFGLTPQEFEVYVKEIREYMAIKYPGVKFNIPGENSEVGNDWKLQWLTEEEVALAKKEGREMSMPSIQMRGSFTNEQGVEMVGSLALGPMPKFKFNGKTIDVRAMIQERIEQKLSAMGINIEQFKFRPGGSTTIDITNADAQKSKAMQDLIKTLNLNPEYVFYFGDEFFVRKGKDGNDEAIAREPVLAKVKTLAVNDDDMEGADPKTLWIGRSPQALQEFFEYILDLIHLDQAMNAAPSGGVDFNDIELKREGKRIEIPVNQAQLEELRVQDFKGFAPVIVYMRPVNQISEFFNTRVSSP